jgi:RES domain-containing protein
MVLIEAELPNGISTQIVEVAALPSDWNAPLPTSSAKDIGSRWIAGNRTVLLSVPSAVIPSERNYLLNPNHPDFSLVRFRSPQPFKFDRRLR